MLVVACIAVIIAETILHLIPPRRSLTMPRESRSVNAAAELIGAYYYPWYSETRHWTEGYKGIPVLGEYDSRDQQVINTHIEWAVSNGIDFFAMSWWGPGSWEDVTLREHFLKASLIDRIKFCIHYETWGRLKVSCWWVNLNDPANRERLRQDFEYLRDTYFNHPSYLLIDGKPVVIIYLARTFVGDVKNVISELREELEENVYLIGDLVYWQNPDAPWQRRLIQQFDAVTAYNMYIPFPGIGKNFVDRVSRRYEEWRQVASELGVGFIPSVMPGFDDTAVRRAKHPVIERSPQLFRDFCSRALQHLDPKLSAVLITSFNEWHEYTQIEPAEEYGMTYLEIVKDVLAGTPAFQK